MSISAKNLAQAQYAPATDTTIYTAPASPSTHTIIDKFTATNTDASARTITVNIVAVSGSVGPSNVITSALSIAAGASVNLPEQNNQILNPGDFISVIASVASKVVVRVSGREVVP